MKTLNLTTGSVRGSLVRFALPIMLTILLQTAYGTADLLIASQFASVGDVSGVTIGSQVMATITSFCTGLSMGTTILLARHIGAGKPEASSRVVGTSITLFGLLAVLISVCVVCFHNQIATVMRTPAEAFSQTTSYLLITGIGAVFIVAYNLVGSIFRGLGDSKTPLLAVAIACIINILLDLLFVAVFEMGASGAALATVIAQVTSVILSLFIISRRQLPFHFDPKDLGLDGRVVRQILTLGVPVALQGALVSVSFLFITAVVNGLGVVASAAVGIVEKITGLVMVVPIAFAQALAAFTAQNYGAKRLDRGRLALKNAMVMSLIFGIITAYLSAFHGTIFTQMFTRDPAVTEAALLYLKSYAFDCVFVAIMFSYTGYFNGCGKTTFVMVQAVGGAFLIRIPLAYLLSGLPGSTLFTIGLATPTSTLAQIVLCVGYYFLTRKGLDAAMEERPDWEPAH